MGTLLYHPGFQTEIKEKRGEKRKQQRKIRQQQQKKTLYQLLEDYLQICIFLGDLLQGKRLVGAFVSVETTNKIFEEINFCTIGKNPSKIRIPLSLFQFC